MPMKHSVNRAGGSNDDDDSELPELLNRNFEGEKKVLRDGVLRTVNEESHKEIEGLSNEKKEALKVLGQMYLVWEPPYGSENGYDSNKFADIDEDLGWHILKKELGVKPVRRPADHLNGSPFSVKVYKEDFGFFSEHNGYGFRIQVFCTRHKEDGRFDRRESETTSLHPTFFRAAIAAVDVARKIKEDWFSLRE